MRAIETSVLPSSVRTRPTSRIGQMNICAYDTNAIIVPMVMVPIDARQAPTNTIAANCTKHMKSDVDQYTRHDPEQMPMPVAIGGVLLRESFDLEFLPGKSPNHADAGQIFLEGGGQHAFGLVGLLERSLHPAEKDDREADDHRHHRRRNQGHFPIDPQQDRNARAEFANRPARSR